MRNDLSNLQNYTPWTQNNLPPTQPPSLGCQKPNKIVEFELHHLQKIGTSETAPTSQKNKIITLIKEKACIPSAPKIGKYIYHPPKIVDHGLHLPQNWWKQSEFVMAAFLVCNCLLIDCLM